MRSSIDVRWTLTLNMEIESRVAYAPRITNAKANTAQLKMEFAKYQQKINH